MKRSKKSSENREKSKKINLGLIAKLEGFPTPLRQLQGNGAFVQFENSEGVVRTYDPKTGKKAYNDYVPKAYQNRKFNTPEEIVSSIPNSVEDTCYARGVKKRYYKY